MAKETTLIFFLIGTLFACSDNSQKAIDTFVSTHSDTAHTSSPDENFKTPSKYFIGLISILDSNGFIPDTNRIEKVEYYGSYPVFIIENTPFYKIDSANNKVFEYIQSKRVSSIPSYDSTRKALLYKNVYQVKNITGFYFADKNISDLRTDAFIEEWEFETESNAEKAEKALVDKVDGHSKTYYFVYFNSFAHIFRKNKYVYTFYSRSNWDERRLEKIYKRISQ